MFMIHRHTRNFNLAIFALPHLLYFFVKQLRLAIAASQLLTTARSLKSGSHHFLLS
jgi:hypothetical protein